MRFVGIFLNAELRTGGQRRLLELYESLAERGNEVTVLINDRLGYEPCFFRAERVVCRYKKGSFYPISASYRASVARTIRERPDLFARHDVVLIHGETSLGSALLLKQVYGLPVLFGLRSNAVREALVSLRDPDRTPLAFARGLLSAARYRLYESQIASACDMIVFQSPYDRDDFCARNPRARLKSSIVRGNIGLPRFDPLFEGTNKSEQARKLIFVGKLGPRKGIRHLLEAMRILKERGFADITLDVIAPIGKDESLRDWVGKKGLDGSVRFHGKVENPLAAIATADLMVVPSDFDSYPDTVLEALHVGTPVIGSSAGGIPDIIGNGDFIFGVQDPRGIADLVARLASDDGAYRTARAWCAERRAFFHFDWAEQWERIATEYIQRQKSKERIVL